MSSRVALPDENFLAATPGLVSQPSFCVPIRYFGRDLCSALADAAALRTAAGGASSALSSDSIIAGFERYGWTLSLPKQVHGDEVQPARWDGVRPEADALIVPLTELAAGRCLGVITADCVPVVIGTAHMVAVVHAGWRGLAARILTKTVQLLGEQIVYCAIGPCAGRERYEVGAEVLEQIGATARTLEGGRTAKSDRSLLDLAATALAELTPWLSAAAVANSDVCTISDARFYSYRRDGAGAGRNLTLVGGPQTSMHSS